MIARMVKASAILLLVILSGCSSMKLEDFDGRQPVLRLEDYFAGQTKAWGIFQDRFGRLRRQFEVDIDGTWDGEVLTLVEDFRYDDGETEQRVWRIRKEEEHLYKGSAHEVVGVAEGRAYGNALHWKYDFRLKVGDGRLTVRFDDWLFLQSDGVLINRAQVTKFGVLIGEVTLVFQKSAPETTAAVGRAPLLLAERS